MPAVLHLLNSYLPATETFIWQYLRQAKDFPPCILADKYEFLERFPLPGGRASLLSLPAHRPLLRRAWAYVRGRYAEVDYPHLKRAMQGRDLALAHIHQGYRACITQGLIRDLGLPFAASFYGSDVSRKDVLRRARSGYAQVFAKAGALFAEGRRLARRLIELGAPEGKVKRVRLAIDMDDYAFAEKSWDGKAPVPLLFAGRLVEKKGLAYGLKAMALAMSGQGAPDFRLTVVGDGPLRGTLEQQVLSLGLQGKVTFAGTLSLSALRERMAVHTILLAPSCTAEDGDAEGGAPTVLLEAQACGLPILATTHDDIPFVTLPGKNALLAPEKDAAALSRALLSLVAKSADWPAMGRAGRDFVATYHDARKAIGPLENLYAEVLGR